MMSSPIVGVEVLPVSPWMILPFAVLLLAIAIAPFINRHWWEKYYPHVSIGLGVVVIAYYAVCLDYHRMVESLIEYFSFIVLIGSLYVVSGGIHITVKGEATPRSNTLFLVRYVKKKRNKFPYAKSAHSSSWKITAHAVMSRQYDMRKY